MSVSTSRLRTELLGGRNPDGGWPYYRGKASRLEPTVWAAVALANTSDGIDALSALRRWAHAGGLLLEHAGGIPNYAFHGLALLAMHVAGVEHESGSASLVAALERAKGIAVEGSFGKRQDNSLQGWPWIAETFSWAEPTGWCLLTLKKLQRDGVRVDTARIDEGERLLLNRSCASGGWNYGNADVNGQDLRPYVPTTAIGILAMQDRRDQPEIAKSLDYLEQHATSEKSGHALALALIGLAVSGKNTAPVRAALDDQLPTTLAIGNFAAIGLALAVLRPEESHATFRL